MEANDPKAVVRNVYINDRPRGLFSEERFDDFVNLDVCQFLGDKSLRYDLRNEDYIHEGRRAKVYYFHGLDFALERVVFPSGLCAVGMMYMESGRELAHEVSWLIARGARVNK